MKTSLITLFLLCVYVVSAQEMPDSLRNSFNGFDEWYRDSEFDDETHQKELARFQAYWKDRAWTDDFNAQYNFVKGLLNEWGTEQTEPIGSDWELIGPRTMGPNTSEIGRVTALWQDLQDPNKFYCGSDQNSGLWYTSNYGLSWRSLTDDLSIPPLGVQDIRQSALQPNYLIATCSNSGQITQNTWGPYSSNILISENGGISWSQVSVSEQVQSIDIGAFGNIAFSPNDNNIAYTVSRNHVWKLELDQLTSGGGVYVHPINVVHPDLLASELQKYHNASFFQIEVLDNGGVDRIFVSSKDDIHHPARTIVSALYSDDLATWTPLNQELGFLNQFSWEADFEGDVDLGQVPVLSSDWQEPWVIGSNGGNSALVNGWSGNRVLELHLDASHELDFIAGTPWEIGFDAEIPAGYNLTVVLNPSQQGEDDIVIFDAVNEYGAPEDLVAGAFVNNVTIPNIGLFYNTSPTEPLEDTWSQAWYTIEIRFEQVTANQAPARLDNMYLDYQGRSEYPESIYLDSFENDLYALSTFSKYGSGLRLNRLAPDIGGVWLPEAESESISFDNQISLLWDANPNFWKGEFKVFDWGVVTGGITHAAQTWGELIENDVDQYGPLNEMHVDLRDIELGTVEGTYILGTDGGVNIYDDGTVYFLNGENLPITQFYGLGVQSNSRDLYAGSIDNSTFEFVNGEWGLIWGGDGGRNEFVGNSEEVISGFINSSHRVRLLANEEGSSDNIGGFVLDQCNEVNPFNKNEVWTAMEDLRYRDVSDFISSGGTTDADFINISVPGLNETYVYGWESTYRRDLNAIAFGRDVNDPTTEYIYVAESRPLFQLDEGAGLEHVKYVFMRYNRSTQEWTDLSDTQTEGVTSDNLLRKAYTSFGIRTIEVDEDNNNHMWVCFNGFNTGEVKYRVLESFDGGCSWQDISDGLPPFPVLDIVHQTGTANRLYAATEIGVYVYLNNEWVPFGHELPICTVNDVDIHRCSGKLYCTTYGRGIWCVDLLPDEEVFEYTESTTISDLVTMSTDVSVADGVTLTITGTLELAANTRIYVQEGAKLIIDGGIVRGGSCGERWKGIEILGWESADTQSPSTQGTVVVENGGVVENARVGISTRTSHPSHSGIEVYSGGIVEIDGASFVNCITGVEISKFPVSEGELQNVLSMDDNLSYIKDATFEWNDDFFEEGVFPNAHIELNEVKNVLIEGCSFLNAENGVSFPSKAAGIGIRSNAASFILRHSDSNENGEFDPGEENTFSKLYRAIYADDYTSQYSLIISNSHFDDCAGGVRLEGVMQPVVVSNEFNIPMYPQAGDGAYSVYPYGLYAFDCASYEIEENSFFSNGVLRNIGICVRNNSNASEEIYKNDFDQLEVGILALGENGSIENEPGGLTLKCNSFSQNLPLKCKHDIAVLDYALQTGTISRTQGAPGSTQSPAGNQFSLRTGSTFSDILIETPPNLLDYYHHFDENYDNTIPVIPEDVVDAVSPIPTNQDFDPTEQGSCVSDVSISLVSDSPSILADFQDAKEDGLTVSGLLYNELDKGSTVDLVAFIKNPANDSWDVRNEMLSASPYVSDAAFQAAFSRYPELDSWHLAQVLLQNSPLNGYVQRLLTESDVEPFYRDLVLANQQGGVSHKNLLIADMFYFGNRAQRKLDDYYKKVAFSIDSQAGMSDLETLLSDADGKNQISGVFVRQANGASIDVTSELDLLVLDSLSQLFVDDLLTAREYLEATSADSLKYEPNFFAPAESSSVGSSIARALDYHEKGSYHDEFLRLPSDAKNIDSAGRWMHQNGDDRSNRPFIAVSPNPASFSSVYRFKAPSTVSSVQVNLTGATGQEVYTKTWNSYIGAEEVDLSRTAPGVYILTMFWDGVRVSATKVVVTK